MMSLAEHGLATLKLLVLAVFGLVATGIEGVDMEFIVTKVLPVVLTIGAGYVLLFADTRYVRKRDFENLEDIITGVNLELAVSKQERINTKETLDRIEKSLENLTNR